jgi:hypothetical protein
MQTKYASTALDPSAPKTESSPPTTQTLANQLSGGEFSSPLSDLADFLIEDVRVSRVKLPPKRASETARPRVSLLCLPLENVTNAYATLCSGARQITEYISNFR